MKITLLARQLWREWVRPLALPVLFIAAAKSSLADCNPVPTGSMKPTILEGDVVFVNKLAYDLKVPFTTVHLAAWANPARGDVVVCFSPEQGTRLVKRVVGLPGDTLELRNERLFINGVSAGYGLADDHQGVAAMAPAERLAAVFAQEKIGGARDHAIMIQPARPALRTFGPIQIPAGHYFMMGDNRDNSHDSRFFGVVARDQIVGRAEGIFISGDTSRWLKPRFDRFFTKME